MTTALEAHRSEWSGTGVTVDRILDQLAQQRDAPEGGSPATLAGVLDLIAYAPSPDDLEGMRTTIERLAGHQPARAILMCECGDERGIDADVATSCRLSDGHTGVAVELVVLTLGHAVRGGAASVAVPLLRADLPTFLWWPAAPPPGREGPLARLTPLADRIVTEAGRNGDGAAAVRALAAWAPACGAAVTDLAWADITAWRQLVVQMIDAPAFAALRSGAARVTVVHGGAAAPADALLLAGWLTDLIGPGAMITLRPRPADTGGLLAMEFEGPPSGRTMVTQRITGREAVEVRVTGGGRDQRRTLPLPCPDRVRLLAGELELQRRDPVFERAAAAAAALVAR